MFSDSTKELNPYNVTDNNVGKTADEMFKDLGYSQVYDDDYIMYQNKSDIAIEIYCGNVAKWSRRFPEARIDFSKPEILACAQLISEMEDKK